MKIKIILSQQSFFVMNKKIGLHFGWDATAVLSAIIDASDMFDEDWVYQTEAMIKDKTGVSGDRQAKFIKAFIDAGFIEKKVAGIPAKRYFKLNDEAILMFLSQETVKHGNLEDDIQETVEHGSKFTQNTETSCSVLPKHIYINKEISNKELNKEIKTQGKPAVSKFKPADALASIGLSEDQIEAYIALRKKQGAPITKHVIQLVINEVDKYNRIHSRKMTIPDAFDYIVKRSWRGFESDWIKDAPVQKNKHETIWEKGQRLGIDMNETETNETKQLWGF